MRTIFIFLIGSFLVLNVHSQHDSTLLSTDPQLLKGKLENGITYYIRENKKPEKKVELRLVIKVGSIVEDNDQLGLAHMAEHMDFN